MSDTTHSEIGAGNPFWTMRANGNRGIRLVLLWAFWIIIALALLGAVLPGQVLISGSGYGENSGIVYAICIAITLIFAITIYPLISSKAGRVSGLVFAVLGSVLFISFVEKAAFAGIPKLAISSSSDAVEKTVPYTDSWTRSQCSRFCFFEVLSGLSGRAHVYEIEGQPQAVAVTRNVDGSGRELLSSSSTMEVDNGVITFRGTENWFGLRFGR